MCGFGSASPPVSTSGPGYGTYEAPQGYGQSAPSAAQGPPAGPANAPWTGAPAAGYAPPGYAPPGYAAPGYGAPIYAMPAPGGYPPFLPVTRTSGKAVTALVLGIVGMVASILGIVLGAVAIVMGALAFKDIRNGAGQVKGKGMAGTGLGLGIAAVALYGMIFGLAFAFEEPARGDLAVYHNGMEDGIAAYERGDYSAAEASFAAADDEAWYGFLDNSGRTEQMWTRYQDAADLCQQQASEAAYGDADDGRDWVDCLTSYDAAKEFERNL